MNRRMMPVMNTPKMLHSFLLACVPPLWLGTIAAPAVEAPHLKAQTTEVAPGIWRLRFGEPEAFTPERFRHKPPMTAAIAELPHGEMPFPVDSVACRVQPGRCVVHLPLEKGSQIFGFGLDPNAVRQRGLMKTLQICAAPVERAGYSHGPVPFYVSTKGYGVWVDTARVAVAHVGRLSRLRGTASDTDGPGGQEPKPSTDEVVFEIPAARGVDVYVFAGPTVREVVQRYNLFSGGGCVPPLWGLGLKYRIYTKATQADVIELCERLRRERIPCDMLGLEPGWQSHSYSCSLAWSHERFPQPEKLIESTRTLGFKLNLWEHAYVHPTSPLHRALAPFSGDYLVWGGLVPDLTLPDARRIFADYHETELLKKGILGFKADECDRQPPTDATPFNFPYATTFPSGIDGEQYSQLFGTLYQQVLAEVFERNNLRTWGDVRASGALAAPYPFLLYSDAYDHAQYLRQLINSTYVGQLWSPELRDARSVEDMVARAEMSAFAPQMCFDMWFIKHPIWTQVDAEKNNAGQFLPNHEQLRDRYRRVVEKRMSLIPYLYASFHQYRSRGLPVLRALPVEYADDPKTWTIEDEYLLGDHLLVAPLLAGQTNRPVYLPKGNWFHWTTRQRFEGGQRITIQADDGETPLFVRDNTLLPLARPVQYVAGDTVFQITVHVFGDHPAPFTLIEDDGVSLDFEHGALNRVTLSWDPARASGTVTRTTAWPGKRYDIVAWKPYSTQ
jgi:alpha-D-xyloside xylohydrolase